MCGDSNRTCIGGTIAILKGETKDSPVPDISLLFNSYDPAFTTATIQSPPGSQAYREELERCQIIIHRTGDLTQTDNQQDILHSFAFRPSIKYHAGGSDSFQLPTKLDLGVGGDGVIGRRVSLVRDTPLGSRVLRQGIIGYN